MEHLLRGAVSAAHLPVAAVCVGPRTSRKLIVFIVSIRDLYQMDIVQIETFLAVGTFGGFRRAADALRVTQPAVSARIKTLEAALGARLFERSRGGLAPSVAGRALRPHAEQILQAVALARQAVPTLQPASAGALQIAAALSICAYLLPDVLQRFRAARPRVLVTVRSGHSKEVLEMVLRGEAELGLARSLQHPAVETVSLGDDPLVLVQDRTRPLVSRRRRGSRRSPTGPSCSSTEARATGRSPTGFSAAPGWCRT
jgi:DNA-binding transcriptional LysR family regulator